MIATHLLQDPTVRLLIPVNPPLIFKPLLLLLQKERFTSEIYLIRLGCLCLPSYFLNFSPVFFFKCDSNRVHNKMLCKVTLVAFSLAISLIRRNQLRLPPSPPPSKASRSLAAFQLHFSSLRSFLTWVQTFRPFNTHFNSKLLTEKLSWSQLAG